MHVVDTSDEFPDVQVGHSVDEFTADEENSRRTVSIRVLLLLSEFWMLKVA